MKKRKNDETDASGRGMKSIRRRRRRGFVRAILMVSLCGQVGRAETGPVVRVGVYQNPPKVLIHPDGRPDGIFVDLIHYVALKEGWKLDFVPGTWADHLQALDEGRLDLLPDVAYSPDRADRFRLSREAVLASWLEVYSQHGIRLESLEDLRGLRVAVLGGSIQQQVVREMLPDLGIAVQEVTVSHVEDVLRAVEEHRADAGIVSRFFGERQAARFRLTSSPLIFHPTKLVFAAPRTSDGRLLDAIDSHLSRLKADRASVYYRILEKWIAEPERSRLPLLLMRLVFGMSVVVLLLGLLVFIMRRLVHLRTEALRQKTRELEQAMERLAHAHEEALRHERMYALGRMASGIAHDFNNCLLSILGYSEMILGEVEGRAPLDSETQHALKMIHIAAQDAAAIVKRMQSYYRANHDARLPGPTDLNSAVRDAVELTRPGWQTQALREGRRIDVEINAGDIPLVEGSPSEWRDVLVNLILNAGHAIQTQGVIRLRTYWRDEWVVVEVADTGCGMTPDVKARCLEPFYTTKGEKGTGMGLTIVQGLVREWGGRLIIQSAPGIGTTVIILVPPHGAASSSGAVARPTVP